MARIFILFPIVFMWAWGVLPAQESGEGKGVAVAYFYTVRWGYQEEFLELYRRNHYPLLEAQRESGRLLDIQTYTPRFHGDGRSDWTFLVILVFKNWEAFGDRGQEEEIIRRLYPDQEKFRREEQRRFELLTAHWDVPLVPVRMRR